MNIIGFEADEIGAVLELLAAILILGNVTFEGYSLPNGTNACKIKNKEGNHNYTTFLVHSYTCLVLFFDIGQFPVCLGHPLPCFLSSSISLLLIYLLSCYFSLK